MTEKLSEFFKANKRTYKITEISKLLKVEDAEELLEHLKKLEVKGEILLNSDKCTVTAFPQNSMYATGVIHINKKGNGFLEYFDKKYEIFSGCLGAAMSGDTVLIAAQDKLVGGKQYAVVKKIIKRKRNMINCEFDGEKLVPIACMLSYPIEISEKDRKKLVEGSIAQICIEDNETKEGIIEGSIERIIGHKNDPDMDLKLIAVNNCIPIEFSEKALDEAYALPTEVRPEDTEGREDFTADPVVTIDCDTTKDMDDAVYVKKLPNGNYELDVHIAHISHYIKPGMTLWDEAVERGNSTYYEDIVLPMLPHIISNGIGSLNPNVLRLTRSTIMEIDKEGNIINYRLAKGVIKSRKKMQYSKVNQILEDNVVPEDYKQHEEQIRLMGELSKIMKKKNEERGIIDFGDNDLTPEIKDNSILGFTRGKQRSAEKLIENFMIAANSCTAEFCKWNDIPAVYRVHETPDSKRLIGALNYLNVLGYRIHNIKSTNNPRAVQGLLKSLKELEEFPLISDVVLRAMQRAQYSINDEGHFGLALEDYAHSTSPIRRLGDLALQHSLDEWEDAMENAGEYDYESLVELNEELARVASMTERRSEAAEEEDRMMRMAEFMEDKIGETFTGMVADVGPYGIMIKCDNEVRGKVNFMNIMGDNYMFDLERFTAVGRRTKETYKLGDKVTVKVESASKEYRTVYFSLLGKNLTPDKVMTLKKQSV